MSRQTIIICDLCQQTVPVAAETWRNLDICGTCAETPRPPGEVLKLIRGAVDGMYVSAEDVIPSRTRRRSPDTVPRSK